MQGGRIRQDWGRSDRPPGGVERLDVLILGATGRYSPLVSAVHDTGHHVRIATRDPEGASRLFPTAGAGREPDLRIVRVDLDDVGSIVEAAHGADAVFAAGTFHRSGPAGDVAHGRNIVDAVAAAGVPHLLYVSVAGADRQSEVPLFEAKRRVEDHLRASGVPSTIIAPVYLMENLWNPWNLPILARGRFPTPLPPERALQQLAIGDVIAFAAFALTHRDQVLGQRIEVASDELSGLEAARLVEPILGRSLEVQVTSDGRPLPLFSWLDRVGYAIDIDGLRARFPEVRWRRFVEWARTQDWSILASAGR